MDRYEKALELARAYYDKDANAFLDTIFPELKESRDEQIRKAIIKSLDMPFPEDNLPGSDVTYEEAVAWLEKQKDHFRDDTKMVEQKPAEVDESTKRLNDNWMKQHFDDYKEQKPAQSRKEILHQLFQNGTISLSDYLYLTGKQKPAEWSDEDEKQIRQIERIVKDAGCSATLQEKIHNWFKSLRPSWRPSEEDIKMLEHIIGQYETGNKNSKVMGYLPRVEELSFLKNVLSKWKN